MRARLRVVIGSILAVLLASTPLAQALQSSSAVPALVPPQITAAHTVFVSNGGGTNYFDAFSGGPDRGYSQLYAALQRWKRYQLVNSPSQADVIFKIRSIAPAVETAGSGPVTYNPQLILRILDPKTGAVLWTTTANVRAFGRQASRDKGFDQSVAVLVDRVRELTGEQLDTAQLKAIRSNSKVPRSEKVLIGSLIGVGVGISAFGIYKVTHMSTPKLPTCADPSFCAPTTP